MAEIEDVLAELRHRIMGRVESGPPKPVPPVEAVAPPQVLHPAMTQPIDLDQRRGSAAVALRRLAHPERDGGVVVEEDSVSEAINSERGGGVVVEDELSGLFKRLSLDIPELMEEVVAFIERRTAEMNGDDGAAPRPTESAAPAALVPATPTSQDDADKTAITLLFDTQVLTRIDAAAKRVGISRTAWLHVAADERLEGRR
jgi:hypothetical protein